MDWGKKTHKAIIGKWVDTIKMQSLQRFKTTYKRYCSIVLRQQFLRKRYRQRYHVTPHFIALKQFQEVFFFKS